MRAEPTVDPHSGGLLRYDRANGKRREYELKEIVLVIERWKGDLYLGTTNGVYVLRGNQLQRFVVEPRVDGGLMIVKGARPKPRQATPTPR